MGKVKKKVAISKKEEEQAQKVVKIAVSYTHLHPFSCFGRRFQEEGESGEGCSLIDDLLSLFD